MDKTMNWKKQVRVMQSVPSILPWGGGHTVWTDPSQKGWRCTRVEILGGRVWVLGQKGVQGCASALLVPQDGDRPSRWDVAFYDDLCLEDLAKRLPTVFSPLADEFGSFLDIPGWGLEVIDHIEEIREFYA